MAICISQGNRSDGHDQSLKELAQRGASETWSAPKGAQKGDTLLVYITGGTGIMAVAKIAKNAEHDPDFEWNRGYCAIIKDVRVIEPPISLSELRKIKLQSGILWGKTKSWAKNPQASSYTVKDVAVENALSAMLRNGRTLSGPQVSVDARGTKEDKTAPANNGAGFGSPEDNRKVEQAAIKIVTDDYKKRGWTVKSVEAEKCGYDLLCTHKDGKELHVEVKGVSGNVPEVILTANERRAAERDSDFVLVIVTKTRSSEAKVRRYPGKSLQEVFSFTPTAYRLTQKTR